MEPVVRKLIASACLIVASCSCFSDTTKTTTMEQSMFTIMRLLDRPIIDSSTHSSIGKNVQGPSLIRVPDWIANPLGQYYLYFADHKGSYIRLAYADRGTSTNQAAFSCRILNFLLNHRKRHQRCSNRRGYSRRTFPIHTTLCWI